ncbi:putative chitinase, partial [Alloprevotella rava]|nr:putative chitinase [Alloprevotella rava]
HCYYLNTCGKAQGDRVTEEQLKNGEVAYKLQNGRNTQFWGQNLDTDNEPQLTSDEAKHIYKVDFTYNDQVKATRYATRNNAIYGDMPTFTAKDLMGSDYNEHHFYTIAFAGGFNGSTTVSSDRTVAVTFNKKDYYEIASKEDWKTFCNIVNDGQAGLDAKLTQNVDLGSDIVMVGGIRDYSGTFDGQAHTLTLNWNSQSGEVAPFKFVNNATIKNLRVNGKIKSDGRTLSALVCNAVGNVTLSGCVSEVDITSNYHGVCELAGMIAYVNDRAEVAITDCVVKGAFNSMAADKKGMAGFVYLQTGYCTLTNCLYAGTNNATAGSYTFGSNTIRKNCYYLNPCGKAQGERIVEKQLESGEVAYKLQNGRDTQFWGQTLGTDDEPQLTTDAAKHVYEVKFTYNNKVAATRYANSGKAIAGGMPTLTAKDLLGTGYNPHHYYTIAFASGFNASTTVTADRQVTVSITEKDCYEISTKADWKAFRDLVNGGQNAVDAKLTRNIDLGSEINMVGDDNNKYSGTFDGQNHTLKLDWSNTNGTLAPFKTVDGATIKNLRTEGEIKSSLNFLSGLVYEAYGNTTISGCISAVNITSSILISACDAAGMIYSVKPGANVTIDDCVVKGNITATTDIGKNKMAGFVGSQEGTCTLNNCLYLGSSNGDTYSRTFVGDASYGATTTLNNCYYLNACGTAQGTHITAEQLKSGEVAKKLQNNRTDKCYWAQQLGEMPDFYNAADKSKANYVYYDTANSRWTCENFRLTDGTPLPIGLNFLATKATYERPFSSKNNATLCLPYDLPVQGFKAYTLSGGNNSAVYFADAKDKLEAYHPYYITADGTPQLDGYNLQVKAYKTDDLKQTVGAFSFIGTVADVNNTTAAAANAYILQDDGKFHKVTTENTEAIVPPYRAYLTTSSAGARMLDIILNGETTGINGVETTDDSTVRYYDLQGRYIGNTLKNQPNGLYIGNGKKIMKK